MRAFTADPKFRNALIVCGRASTAAPLVEALVGAGASRVFVGVAETWKPFAAPSRGETVPLDPTDPTSVSDLARRFGDKVDILVNNADYFRPGGLIAGSDASIFRAAFETNCLGMMRLAAAFGPIMQARAAETGRAAAAFVNIISAWSLSGAPEYGAYAATQAALRSLSHGLRAQMRPSGLKVVDVLTGPIDDEWRQTHEAAEGRARGDRGGRRRGVARGPRRSRGRRNREGDPRQMGGRPAPAAPGDALSDAVTGAVTDLAAFASAIADGRLRVIDLTQTLDPDFPTIVLPPELGQSQPFRIEEISHYDHRGPAWYWNNFSMGEHAGTHFDAPAHWVTGRDLPNGTVDAIDPKKFIAPACVIDCSAEAAADPDHLLETEGIAAWERAHGPIPEGAWALMRTDWSKRSPADYANLRDDGAHTPGPSAAAIRFLVEARGILGFGTETIGTDAGQAHHFSPPYPAHSLLHGSGRYGLQCLANLHLLPPTGAVLIAAPLKIVRGSGSPLRVLALAPATGRWAVEPLEASS